MTRWWSRLRPDNFTLALLCTVGLASLLPMKGAAAIVLDDVTTVAIAALFFLHGARLPRESIDLLSLRRDRLRPCASLKPSRPAPSPIPW